MANLTTTYELPPLPEYSVYPRPPLIPWMPDKYLCLVLPIVAYWVISMFFHFIDVNDFFPQYRLHTPAEVLKRNHVSRWDVFRDVIIQQIFQSFFAVGLTFLDPQEMAGKELFDIAVWAQRVRLAQRPIPWVLASLGVDAPTLSTNLAASHPFVAGILNGGFYPALLTDKSVSVATSSTFASWELFLARTIYYAGVPALQFLIAILILDTWQYFWHRWMHTNKFLYTTIHSRHHRLYVPYAYGALYNHPVEGFVMDTLGAGLGYLVTGMTPRQGMTFFVGTTFKTVDDHCGYKFPWDPLQHITNNNAAYHDIHHQSWGIKTNFSQPYFTFWDRIMGTMWKGGDVSTRYERDRRAMERREGAEKFDKTEETPSSTSSGTEDEKTTDDATATLTSSLTSSSKAVPEPPAGNISLPPAERPDAQASVRRSPRKQRLSTSGPSSSSLPKGCWSNNIA